MKHAGVQNIFELLFPWIIGLLLPVIPGRVMCILTMEKITFSTANPPKYMSL